ncbi:hypothetical protein PR202_ga16877 [Eleusine coracana subsp. coracana]|uniref:Ycf20-like protein n=1 Tax=Eleusine coracana subsp. coracana TaxID=191504 RepID=A0AAV5CNV9_ELECO|nr:hypothetical protein PR202_ga16877 [Eleusine coracana subsp. coracana]
MRPTARAPPAPKAQAGASTRFCAQTPPCDLPLCQGLACNFSSRRLPAASRPEVSLLHAYQVKNTRWRPVFALETGGSPNSDDQDFEDTGFLGRTRLGRLIRATARELLQKLNSGRTNSPTKIFLLLLGFYTANALATILGQTGDWDVLVAAVVVAAIEGIGMLMYRKPVASPPGRFQSLIGKMNYWKAGALVPSKTLSRPASSRFLCLPPCRSSLSLSAPDLSLSNLTDSDGPTGDDLFYSSALALVPSCLLYSSR